jgi:hypothetical protein
MCSIRFLLSVGVMGCLLSQSAGAADVQQSASTDVIFMDPTHYDTFTDLGDLEREMKKIELYLAGILTGDMMKAYHNAENQRDFLARLLANADKTVPVAVRNKINNLISLIDHEVAILRRSFVSVPWRG